MGTSKEKYIQIHGEEAWEKESKRRKERNQQYYYKHKEHILEIGKEYYKEHKRERLNQMRQYWLDNKEHFSDLKKQWYLEHPYLYRQYRKTQKGRAVNLSKDYKKYDRKRGFDTSNSITANWIIDNIFTSKCIYCGRDDWKTLGADRIDNSKPHTPDNVVCCCGLCNIERQDKYTVEEFKQYKQLHPTLVLGPLVKNPDGSIKKRSYIKV